MENITDNQSNYATAYFASGCFWCVEAVFESVKGVYEVISGYSGGNQNKPSYASVSRGYTDYAESVEIHYDLKVVSYEELVKAFFGSHDPTQLNGQGPDKGRHYRSIAFYQNEQEKEIIVKYMKSIAKNYDNPIVTQVTAFDKFWKAEDYHQNYEKLNPNNPYIRGVSVPRVQRFQDKFPKLLKKNKH